MKIILFGAGHVGLALAKQFSESDDIKQIMVCDRRGLALEQINEQLSSNKIRTHRIGLEQETMIKSVLKGFNVVLNALPQQFAPKLANLALQAGLHYIDLGSTQQTYEKQEALKELALQKKKLILPNCGFSPGLLNILAMNELNHFDSIQEMTLRSGCLPLEPQEPFNYKLVIAAEALLSEYVDPQLCVENHKVKEVNSLEGLHPLSFDDFENPLPLEAFTTGNRINSLVPLLKKKVENLRYEAIRYQGHCRIMQSLNKLEFCNNDIFDVRSQLSYRQLLVRQLEKHLQSDSADITLMQIQTKGLKDGIEKQSLLQMSYTQETSSNVSSLLALTALSTLLITKSAKDSTYWEKGGFYNPEEIINPKEFVTQVERSGIRLVRT